MLLQFRLQSPSLWVRFARILAVAALLPGLAACVTDKQGEQMRQDILQNQAKLEATQSRLRELELKFDQLKADHDGRLARMEEDTLRTGTNTQDELDKLRQTIRDLRSAVDQLTVRVNQLGGNRNPPPQPPAPTPPTDAGPPPEMEPTDPKGIYEKAMSLIKEGKIEEGIQRMGVLVTKFPQDPLADNAMWAIGEARFKQRQFDRAIDTFNELMARYPKSDHEPGAYYMIGRCYEEQKNYKFARVFYRRVVEKAPKTDWATQAQQRLAKLPPD